MPPMEMPTCVAGRDSGVSTRATRRSPRPREYVPRARGPSLGRPTASTHPWPCPPCSTAATVGRCYLQPRGCPRGRSAPAHAARAFSVRRAARPPTTSLDTGHPTHPEPIVVFEVLHRLAQRLHACHEARDEHDTLSLRVCVAVQLIVQPPRRLCVVQFDDRHGGDCTVQLRHMRRCHLPGSLPGVQAVHAQHPKARPRARA